MENEQTYVIPVALDGNVADHVGELLLSLMYVVA